MQYPALLIVFDPWYQHNDINLSENWSSGIPPDGDTMFSLTMTKLTPNVQDRVYPANKFFLFVWLLNEALNNIYCDVDNNYDNNSYDDTCPHVLISAFHSNEFEYQRTAGT